MMATPMPSTPSSKKRKRPSPSQAPNACTITPTKTQARRQDDPLRTPDEHQHDCSSSAHSVKPVEAQCPPKSTPTTPRKRSKMTAATSTTPQQQSEKRLRIFRKQPPQSFRERLHRASTQRMFLLDRQRRKCCGGGGGGGGGSIGAEDVGVGGAVGHDEELFDIAGTTGNVYQVLITKQPTCTCPDGRKGNQCKHIVYVMHNVLKAPEHLVYQLALLSTELNDIFAKAPVTPQAAHGDAEAATLTTDTGGHRKAIEGDCPVCVMPFTDSPDAGLVDGNGNVDGDGEILWCKAACGNNIHRVCFEQWARSKPGVPKCVYCRTPWKHGGGDGPAALRGLSRLGVTNVEGYVNVGGQLGLDPDRDTSTYHSHWVRRTYGGYAY